MTDPRPPHGLRVWVRDLAMGCRFATSGRQGWARTLLTAVGVGLGVALLLGAASVPTLMNERDARGNAMSVFPDSLRGESATPSAGDRTIVTGDANTTYRDLELYGRTLQADGAHPVTPPGVDRFPGPGEMVVSPALEKVLASGDAQGLVKRLDAKIVGTIGKDGLRGPGDLAFYRGTDKLVAGQGAHRIDSFGTSEGETKLDPSIVLLAVVACAVLLMPIAVFVGTAARFGSERRDRRLAALRLVGADAAMARRMGAGESLVGAVLGLVLGTGIFLAGRGLIERIQLFDVSVFATDLAPSPALAALVALGVPAVAVAVSLFAMRGITIEPLGVLRESVPRPRRLWWRLAPPVVGALLLLPLSGKVGGDSPSSVNELQVAAGVVLLLSGVALLLPWVVERLVRRIRGGGISWQLATRRLQLSSGSSTRAVSGITIAVAGAIALQMLFAGVQSENTETVGGSGRSQAGRTEFDISMPGMSDLGRSKELDRALERTPGVREVSGNMSGMLKTKGKEEYTSVMIGSCATLRELAHLDSCREGQVFRLRPTSGNDREKPPAVGTAMKLKKIHGSGTQEWRVPASAASVRPKPDERTGYDASGLLATPSAIAPEQAEAQYGGWVSIDKKDEQDALEQVRTTVFHQDPAGAVFSSAPMKRSSQDFAGISRAIFAASVAVLLIIGASLVVSIVEQLRERKRQLAVLVAFGTRRSTLGASVLWQSAVPVVLGLTLASGFGLGLGWMLLRTMDRKVTDWLVFAPMVGVGAGVIALVSLLSLPSLWRTMRPEGLRTE
ncbi:ABC transporter permease [Streptomyces sp. NRRL S-1868]|uniref:ABC transporter permease n=1 Tax=Streptomyces sp. NRRL S-1868 TaxID=1463892 RepID=UPI0004CC8936|nr:ABC transporter permease [Streptomyces sp. NRRL S-1868]